MIFIKRIFYSAVVVLSLCPVSRIIYRVKGCILAYIPHVFIPQKKGYIVRYFSMKEYNE